MCGNKEDIGGIYKILGLIYREFTPSLSILPSLLPKDTGYVSCYLYREPGEFEIVFCAPLSAQDSVSQPVPLI